MRRFVLVCPGLVGTPEESLLRGRTLLGELAARAPVFGLRAPSRGLYEAAVLGADPHQVDMAEGPLTLAAMGLDPPADSTQMRLSLIGTDGQHLLPLPPEAPPDHVRALMQAVSVLNTDRLALVAGEGYDHGLVWLRGSLDLQLTAPSGIEGPWADHMPQGDGEAMLRRLIDDSLNILAGHEVNKMREEEGLVPLNLLWPWGPGRRGPVPNLAIALGEPVRVESSSLRLQGLSRLAGFRHGSRRDFGRGLSVKLERLRAIEEACIVHLDAFDALRANESWEEMDWLLRELETRLIGPLAESEDPIRVALLFPGLYGVGLIADLPAPASYSLPLDERIWEERLLAVHKLHEAVHAALIPPGSSPG